MSHNNLSNIPRIIEYLERRGYLDVQQANEVRNAIRHNEFEGLFAGDIAVKKGFIDRETLDQQLCERALSKVNAALDDFRYLRKNGTLTLEEWQVPAFGNQKVNETRADMSRKGAAAIAANIARLIVILAADYPETAKNEVLFKALLNARDMVRALTYGISSFAPLDKKHDIWVKQLEEGLRLVAAKANIEEAVLEKYINNRFNELQQGIKQELAS